MKFGCYVITADSNQTRHRVFFSAHVKPQASDVITRTDGGGDVTIFFVLLKKNQFTDCLKQNEAVSIKAPSSRKRFILSIKREMIVNSCTERRWLLVSCFTQKAAQRHSEQRARRGDPPGPLALPV